MIYKCNFSIKLQSDCTGMKIINPKLTIIIHKDVNKSISKMFLHGQENFAKHIYWNYLKCAILYYIYLIYISSKRHCSNTIWWKSTLKRGVNCWYMLVPLITIPLGHSGLLATKGVNSSPNLVPCILLGSTLGREHTIG